MTDAELTRLREVEARYKLLHEAVTETVSKTMMKKIEARFFRKVEMRRIRGEEKT